MRIASPIGGAAPMLAPFDDEHEAYRLRIREALAAFPASEVDRWEQDGHIPGTLVRRLGAAGAFRDRWAPGRTDGLPYALVLAEEIVALSSGGAGVAVTLHSEVFAGTLHRLARTPAQRELLESALDGRTIGCFASTEDHGGSAVGEPRTTATPTADGGWHITGVKRYSSNAGRATHAVVIARSAAHAPGRDICLFVVPLDAPGVTVDGFFDKQAIRSCDLGRIRMDVTLPGDALLGAPGTGLIHANQALQLERLSVAAQGVAISRMALGLAIAHCRDRSVGDARLMDMQAIRHRLADAATALTAAEAFVHAVTLGAMSGRNVAHESAALKLHCAHVTAQVVDETLQVLGARGVTSNYPVERWWRDARVMRLGAGSDEMMREIVAAGLDRRRDEYDARLGLFRAADQPRPAGTVMTPPDLPGTATLNEELLA